MTHVLSIFNAKALIFAYNNVSTTIHYGSPPFHNLTELEFNVEICCRQTLLYDFLENSPNLQIPAFPPL